MHRLEGSNNERNGEHIMLHRTHDIQFNPQVDIFVVPLRLGVLL
jgi:hypothetical protein